MKILNSKQPSMDNKLKFSDRFKVLLNPDTQKGADPYVFNDTEQPLVVATGGKNIKLIAPKNSKTPSTNKSKSKGKCLKTQIKADPIPNFGIKQEPGIGKDLKRSHYLSEQKQKYLQKLQRLKEKSRSRDHTLQYYPRAGDEILDSDGSENELQTYQRHWYSGEADPMSARTSRLACLHSQLQRQLQQLRANDDDLIASLKNKTRCLLQAAIRDPSAAARILDDSASSSNAFDGPLIIGGPCGAEGCELTSLPSTRHCSKHIMMNGDQLLFEYCTAKFSDNTQCCIPVFDVTHELPLCPEHARKRDNYHRKTQESKPKKPRSKKPSSPTSAATSQKPSKSKSKPKKRKRPPSTSKLEIENIALPVPQISVPVQPLPPVQMQQLQQQPQIPNVVIPPPVMPVEIPTPMTTAAPLILSEENHYTSPMITNIISNDIHHKTLNNLNMMSQINLNAVNLNNLGLDVGLLGNGLKVELDDHEVFAPLDHVTDHDFENVLNNLPPDTFNDFFIEGRNGDYEPSHEDEEELSRVVESFDKEAKNCYGQPHGLLEPALLAQLMSDIAS